MNDKTLMQSASPILAALDIEATLDFYQNKLGFKLVSNYEGYYLIFERDGIWLHLSKYDEFTPQNNPFSCYIYVKNIEPLYEEYKAQGAVHPNSHLETRDYGLKEFTVLDPNGNCVRIGEIINPS